MRITKKLMSLLLAAALAAALLPRASLPVRAADSAGKCGENLTWSFDEATGTLTVSGTGEMTFPEVAWDAIPVPWYEHHADIKAIRLPEGLTSIAEMAFSGCENLTSVTIPDSVARIDAYAFEACAGLTSVTVPDGVTSISAFAFVGCAGLTSVTIPDSVTSIGEAVFGSCGALTHVTLPGSITRISDYAFESCGALTGVTIQDGVTGIGLSAFGGCGALTSVTIPDSVTSIDSYAFERCVRLADVTIPDSVTSIGYDVFLDTACRSDPGNWENGCLYIDHALTETTQDLSGTCAVRNGTTVIGSAAFRDRREMTGIVLPDSVKGIGEDAFYGCGGLTEIEIPAGVEFIGADAFTQCQNLSAIRVRDGNPNYSSIDGVLFSKDRTELIYCPETRSGVYHVPEGVTDISESAFMLCGQLTAVTIPASVERIGLYSFYYAYSLETITVDPGNPVYSSVDGVLYDTGKKELFMCPRGKTGVCRVPDGVVSIGDNAFNGCPLLTGVSLSDSVAHIGLAAFWNCPNLTEINAGADNPDFSSADGVLFSKDGTALLALPDGKTGAYLVPKSVNEIPYGAISGSGLTSIAILNPECEIYDSENMLGNRRTTTVLGYAGSTAERYCEAYGYSFRTIDSDTGFIDVKAGAYYAEPVAWAVEKGVTKGTGSFTFSPDSTCTRAQVVTFLWRAMGEPEPARTANPFTDVKEGQYYYKAVLWAVEQGITTGTSATAFSPDAGCTRAQVVTFLWRAEGQPEPASAANPFRDVADGQYYSRAVLWAVEKGITKGTSADRFSPGSTCTRGQIVTFLYRDRT